MNGGLILNLNLFENLKKDIGDNISIDPSISKYSSLPTCLSTLLGLTISVKQTLNFLFLFSLFLINLNI